MTAVPAGWQELPLGEVADTALGKMLDKSRDTGRERVPYLRNLNVQWGRIDTEDLGTVELDEAEVNRFSLNPGDLLVCEGGEVGRAALWSGSGYMAYQKALHRIRPRPGLDSRFLRYLLEHLHHTGYLASVATGSTIRHLPQEKLRALPVPLPPIEEQRRIVDTLEDHLSRLDAAESTLHTSSRRAVRLEQAFLDRASQQGDILPLGDVTEIQGGIQKQPKRDPRSNAFPFLRVANVTSTGLDLKDVHLVELFGTELERLRLKAGDLLVVEGNGSASQVGRAAMWDGSIPDCVHQNHLIRVRPLPAVLPQYLEAVWNSPGNRGQLTRLASSSSGLHTLSIAKLKSLTIAVPSLQVQRDLVQDVEAGQAAVSRAITSIDVATRRSNQLRRALLMAAFSGNLGVHQTSLEGELRHV